MNRNAWVYMSQVLWEQDEMAYRATFFRSEILMPLQPPVITYQGVELTPLVYRYGNVFHLYFPKGTELWAEFPERYTREGWRRLRQGTEPDKSVILIIEKCSV